MKPQISARWRPGHRVYRNDDTGEYAEVNGPLLSADECRVQRALLRNPVRSRVECALPGQIVILPPDANDAA